MPTLLIKNGRVIDPSQTMDRITNLLIRDGRIAGYDVPPNGQDAIIDAAGKVVSPGLIDMHVHLREPGARRMKRSPPARPPRWPADSRASPAFRTPSRRSTPRAPSSSSSIKPLGPITAT